MWRHERRGVLEGVPLTLIISVLILTLGTLLLFTLVDEAELHHLSTLEVARGQSHLAVSGWLPSWASPLHFEITALSETKNGLSDVIVEVNGSGIDLLTSTASNGTAVFLLPLPVLPEHATSGPLNLLLRYSPPTAFGGPSATETLSTTLVILA